MTKNKCKKCKKSTKDSLAEELNLCQDCWEEEVDRNWWLEIFKLKIKNNMRYQKLFWFLMGMIITWFLIRNIKFF